MCPKLCTDNLHLLEIQMFKWLIHFILNNFSIANIKAFQYASLKIIYFQKKILRKWMNDFWHNLFGWLYNITHTVFPHIVAAATILFWNCKTLKISNSFLINFPLKYVIKTWIVSSLGFLLHTIYNSKKE